MPALPAPVLLLAQQLTQGGSERQLVEIAKALDRTRLLPHAGVLRPGGVRAAELESAGVPLTCFPTRSFRSLSTAGAAWRLARYLKEHRIRLVHCFDTPMNLFAAPIARAAATPCVLTSQRAFRELFSPLERRLLRLTDRIADAIVVNCRALERHLIEEEGVAAARVRLCYNGVDVARFSPGLAGRPAALAEASIIVGSVCALRPEKSLETLLQAFAAVRGSRWKLLLVGDGPQKAALVKLAAELGISGDVHFEPTTGDVVPYLRAMDIFVLPSRSEALSNALMEAMACGAAVIASRTGGNPELVAHGERGLLFAPQEVGELAAQLKQLAEDADWRRSLGEAARRFICENFSLARAARRMEEIYLEHLEGVR